MRATRRVWPATRSRHSAGWSTLAILEQVPLLSTLARDAASHHEHIDGRGYHLGLTGAELSVSARILAVADALAADCPCRAALPADTVVATLQRGAGAQFCPACIDVCTPDLVAVEAA